MAQRLALQWSPESLDFKEKVDPFPEETTGVGVGEGAARDQVQTFHSQIKSLFHLSGSYYCTLGSGLIQHKYTSGIMSVRTAPQELL